MAAKRLSVLAVPVLVLVSSALAQDFNNWAHANEVSITAGRTFVSTQTVPSTGWPIHFGNEITGTTPKDIGALFVTPSVRVNIFSGQSVTPWVSAGGGYGRFREAPVTLYGNPNPGPTGSNTGVAQFGAGLDVWVWQRWGARLEARDFYSGAPALNVDTGRSRQHNYYVGIGVVRRF